MRFPVANTIKKGESLSGFLSRIVISNNYVNLGPIAELLGFTRNKYGLSTSNISDIITGNFDLLKLAELSENNIHKIENAKLQLPSPKPGCETDNYISIRKWRVCPECLHEDRGHQKFWQIAFTTACPKHGKKLLDQCPACNKKLSASKVQSFICTNCSSHLVSEVAAPYEIFCSTKLEDKLNIDDLLQSDGLDNLLHRLMAALYLSSSVSLRKGNRFSPQLMSVEEMGELLETIWEPAKTKNSLLKHISYLQYSLKAKWPYLQNGNSILLKNITDTGVNIPSNTILKKGTTPLLAKKDSWLVSIDIGGKLLNISAYK